MTKILSHHPWCNGVDDLNFHVTVLIIMFDVVVLTNSYYGVGIVFISVTIIIITLATTVVVTTDKRLVIHCS